MRLTPLTHEVIKLLVKDSDTVAAGVAITTEDMAKAMLVMVSAAGSSVLTHVFIKPSMTPAAVVELTASRDACILFNSMMMLLPLVSDTPEEALAMYDIMFKTRNTGFYSIGEPDEQTTEAMTETLRTVVGYANASGLDSEELMEDIDAVLEPVLTAVYGREDS